MPMVKRQSSARKAVLQNAFFFGLCWVVAFFCRVFTNMMIEFILIALS